MQQNLNTQYAELLKNLSITEFNEMQKAVIEKASVAPNVTLLSPTGSGKTLGFLIPVLKIGIGSLSDSLRLSVSGAQELLM